MTMFKKLFEPGYIGKLKVKNRISLSAMSTRLASRDGSVTSRLLNYYKERAKGGSGLIMIETSNIDDKASAFGHCLLNIYDESFVAGLSTLARVIQDNGAKAGIQISHAGRERSLKTYPTVAPSPMAGACGVVPAELTIEEIKEIIKAFGNAARFVEQSGFDMVEILGAHGYLITQFLSPLANRRGDMYGGNLQDRMRFAREVVDSVRNNVSRDFPVGMKITGSDYLEGGITIEDSKELAQELEKMGIDILHVDGAVHETTGYLAAPMLGPTALHVHLAEAIKSVVNIPVVVSGSIINPQLGEEILQKGQADFISLARPLLADPWFPKKAREGRVEDIVPCIRCNDGCILRSTKLGRVIRCTVNVVAGFEGEYEIKPAERVKKIAVIGGGPGGMEAALVAAQRGHDVTLFDKRKRLGGRLSEMSELIMDLASFIDYLSTQLKKMGVKVILGKEVTVHTIQDHGFDSIVLATGRKPLVPNIRGIDKPLVMTIDDLLEGKEVGQNVVVVGGGLVGCETAFFLALAGKLYGLSRYRKVLARSWEQRLTRLLIEEKLPSFARKQIRIIEPTDNVAADIEEGVRQVIFQGFSRWGVQINVGLRLDEVTEKGIVAVDRYGEKHSFEADSVVLTSCISSNDLLEELEKANMVVYPVGDCVEPRKIYDAIHEGFLTSYRL